MGRIPNTAGQVAVDHWPMERSQNLEIYQEDKVMQLIQV